MAERMGSLPQQRGYGRLAVGAGDAYKCEVARRIVKPCRSQQSEGHRRIGHTYPYHIAGMISRNGLAHNGHGAGGQGLGYIVVSVDGGAAHGHKHSTRHNRARIGREPLDDDVAGDPVSFQYFFSDDGCEQPSKFFHLQYLYGVVCSISLLCGNWLYDICQANRWWYVIVPQ